MGVVIVIREGIMKGRNFEEISEYQINNVFIMSDKGTTIIIIIIIAFFVF